MGTARRHLGGDPGLRQPDDLLTGHREIRAGIILDPQVGGNQDKPEPRKWLRFFHEEERGINAETQRRREEILCFPSLRLRASALDSFPQSHEQTKTHPPWNRFRWGDYCRAFAVVETARCPLRRFLPCDR